MKITRIAVIMAGGAGERFWPLSRQSRPKQLLNLDDPRRCLLQEAIARLAPLIPPERILVVTGRHLVAPIRAARVGVPDENVLAEPLKRNTAGCLAYAAAVAQARFGAPARISMAVVTADHRIQRAGRFRAAVAAALNAAETQDALVTIGVRPDRPETGYGYIEVADPAAGKTARREQAPMPKTAMPARTPKNPEVQIFPVAQFCEKPDRITAEAFLRAGRFYWNSGMFFWKLDTFLSEMKAATPAIHAAIAAMARALAKGDVEAVEKTFAGLPDISIDYALMEKARRRLVTVSDFGWDDIGAWDALDRTLPHDAAGNVAVGDPILVDSTGCIVYNEAGAARMAVGVIGMKDVAVIVAGDAVLVVPKQRAQEVKEVVKALRARRAPQL